jgi:hypothetical protein
VLRVWIGEKVRSESLAPRVSVHLRVSFGRRSVLSLSFEF